MTEEFIHWNQPDQEYLGFDEETLQSHFFGGFVGVCQQGEKFGDFLGTR